MKRWLIRLVILIALWAVYTYGLTDEQKRWVPYSVDIGGTSIPVSLPAFLADALPAIQETFSRPITEESLQQLLTFQGKPAQESLYPDSPDVSADNTWVYGISIGMSQGQVEKVLGKPNRVDPSHLGLDWWVYNQDLRQYLLVGMQEGKVVSLFTNGETFKVKGVTYGSKLEQVKKNWGTPSKTLVITPSLSITDNLLENHPSYLEGDVVYTFAIDKPGGNRVMGVRISSREHFSRIALGLMYRIVYTKVPDPLPVLNESQLYETAKGYERQVFELANTARLRAGLPLLTWNEQAADVARSHNVDMAVNRFFDHHSPTSGSPFDRLKRAGISYSAAGENIASGQLDAVEAHIAWMNSPGHRKNILNDGFQTLGVGVLLHPTKGLASQTWYTQNFVTKQ